jgi:calcium-dependent protein kinase
MYWLLSNSYPFKGDTEEKLLESLESDPLVTNKGAWADIPKPAIEVVTALLQIDDKRRRKCEDVLGMEYFEGGETQEVSIQVLQMAAKNLKEYSKLNVLEKGARTALAWSIPNDKSAELRLLFRTIDTDGGGSIDCKELGELLIAQALLQEDEAEELFAQLDTDGSGSLDYTEFLAATVSVHEGMEDDLIRSAFRAVDTDDSGTVSRKELNSLFRGFREHVDMPELKKTKGHQFCDQAKVSLGEKAIEKMLELYDENGDGDIDFEEFRAIIRGEGKQKAALGDCLAILGSCGT